MNRRNFIKQSGLIAGALALPPELLALGKDYERNGGMLWLPHRHGRPSNFPRSLKSMFPPPPPPANVPSCQAWHDALGNPSMSNQVATVTNNTNNITISHKIFDDPTAKQIDFNNCDTLLIEECFFTNASGRCIELENCDGVEIRYCYFEDVAMAMYFLSCTNIYVHHCVALNLLGPPPPSGFGQMTQFNQCNAPDSIVENCYVVNLPGQSDSEDKFNFYKTNGTSGHPVICRLNYVWGWGPSTSGTGILISDGDTSSASSYVEARDNVIIYSGQVGIGCASGNNCIIDGNLVYGDQQTWSNVGVYVYDPYPVSGGCANNTVSNNRVWWKNSGGSNNPKYIPTDNPATPPECTDTVESGNTYNDATLTDAETPPGDSLWWATPASTPQNKRRILLKNVL